MGRYYHDQNICQHQKACSFQNCMFMNLSQNCNYLKLDSYSLDQGLEPHISQQNIKGDVHVYLLRNKES